MTLLDIAGVQFEADLVAFDKDGTLMDFDRMWGRLAEAWAEALAPGEEWVDLRLEMHRSWGYDPAQRRTAAQSPLAIATTAQFKTIAASVLYRHGIPWPEAEDRVGAAFRRVADELPLADLVHPTGDVAGLLSRLQGAGVRVAVITTDDRAETEEGLRILGVEHLVDHVFCGDDALPIKPAPDALLATCKALEVSPMHSAVVGDTVADLLMGERAGAGLRIAVLTGAGEQGTLAAHADVVIESIDGIGVEG
jgi:phosphoglycolate phosphatase-like HAD superfamily hydrolase